MHISNKGLDLIKHEEAFMSHPYLDVALVPTIGYGTTHYNGGRAVTMSDHSISRDTATLLLRDQIDKHYGKMVNHYVRVPVTQNQFDALVSFAYNVGTGALKHSTLLRKLNHGDYDAIPDELLKWTHAGGKVVKGLIARRKKEASLFLA